LDSLEDLQVELVQTMEEIDTELLSPEISPESEVLKDQSANALEWSNLGEEFELDMVSSDVESNLPSDWRQHCRAAKLSTLVTSALIHNAIFFSLAFFQAQQVAGAAGHAGGVISVKITASEDLVPQDESPASVDSAASTPSVAGKAKKPERHSPEQYVEKPVDIHDPGPEPNKIVMSEKPKSQEKKEEKKHLEKEVTKKNEKPDKGGGPQNSMASMPSVASAERRFIPAAGQDGEAFQSRVLSAIREAIFFPKQAVKERHHGEVVVAFAIAKDGSISSLHVTKPSGSPILDEAAIKSIQKAAAKFPAIPHTMNKQSMDYVVPILFKEKRG
jgi:periplasmic protein TonB